MYRGISGAALPDAFWQPNQFAVRGGVEFSFLSCTRDRAVAMSYAGQGHAGTVFEMQQGMVDRGADVGWLSMYPHELEVLFAPLCGLEARRTRVEGAVLVVESRLNINLASATIEQVVSRRRKLLREMSETVRDELRREQTIRAIEGRDALLAEVEAMLLPLQSHEPEWYAALAF